MFSPIHSASLVGRYWSVEWNIGSHLRQLSNTDLASLQEMAVDLLDLLKRNLPDKCGEKGGWNFDKAHSILHKVRDIIMWGNSDNISCALDEDLQDLATGIGDVREAVKPWARPCLFNSCIDESDLPQ